MADTRARIGPRRLPIASLRGSLQLSAMRGGPARRKRRFGNGLKVPAMIKYLLPNPWRSVCDVKAESVSRFVKPYPASKK
jgi:hypothetical protein